MEGFVAILLCAIMAAGGLLTAGGMNKARKQAETARAKAIMLAGVVCFSILGGFAATTALVLVCAWVVSVWW